MSSSRIRRFGLSLLFLASGVPGLAAQVTWTRVFAAGLGHEVASLLGVVSAFFAGLAAGAWILDSKVGRSAVPARWYAGLELFSAAWIAFTTPWLGAANEAALRMAGSGASVPWQLLVAFALPLGIVGPAAAAMGSTLAAMERAVVALVPDHRAVSTLYALNTLGGVFGALGTVFVAMPALGLRGTLMAAAAIQGLIGISVVILERGRPGAPTGSLPAGVVTAGFAPAPDQATGRGSFRWWVTAAGSGLLGMGCELLGVRALAQTTENTIQTFALVLSVFLAGTALGAWLNRVGEKRGNAPAASVLFPALALSVMAGIGILSGSVAMLAGFRRSVGGLGAEVLMAGALFGGPTLFMGAVFGRVTQMARAAGVGVGRMVGWNTLGGALAAPLFMCVALPVCGLKWAMVLVGLGYVGLGILWRPGKSGWVLASLAAGAVLILPEKLELVEMPRGADLRWHDEGMLATVSVVRTADGHRALRVNNHFQQGGTATATAAQRHALLPLLLRSSEEVSSPRRVLFLGVGTGLTLGSAVGWPGLEVDGVELLPGVLKALPFFEPENGAPGTKPGVRLINEDARRFVRTSPGHFDLIVADLFHPTEDGAGFLYTRDHFAAVRERLAAGGLFCQWLPLHQMDEDSFKLVARTFLEVFPGATLWLLRSNVDVPVVGLVGGSSGSGGEVRWDWARLERLMSENPPGSALRAVGLGDPLRVFGSLLADADGLRRLAGVGPVATDDRPMMLFRGAAFAYADKPSPSRLLAGLLERCDAGFGEGAVGELRWGSHRARLASYREARDRHLRGLASEAEGRRGEAVEAYVASAAASADYTAGYAQAVLVASAYLNENPAFARQLLSRLVQVRPEQRLAKDLLERVGAGK